MSASASAVDHPDLVLADGWVIDWISVDRMARQLAVAPSSVVGIAASTGPLPSGASYRTHAEHLALRPRGDTELVQHAPDGAVLWRQRPFGRGAHALGDVVGPVLVDHGAHAHDPGSTPRAPTMVATTEGRSPFPVRPLVLFVQGGDDLDPRVPALVNDLLALDVEARLASSNVPPGPHLTRPCAPTLASLRALRPDLVVPTDAAAGAMVGEWAETATPSLISIELDDAVPELELVSWRRTVNDGPARARISPGIEPAVLAQLVIRLSSGPRPLRLADVEAP